MCGVWCVRERGGRSVLHCISSFFTFSFVCVCGCRISQQTNKHQSKSQNQKHNTALHLCVSCSTVSCARGMLDRPIHARHRCLCCAYMCDYVCLLLLSVCGLSPVAVFLCFLFLFVFPIDRLATTPHHNTQHTTHHTQCTQFAAVHKHLPACPYTTHLHTR